MTQAKLAEVLGLAADALMHARHFSSPYSWTIEDSVTGTAFGVMGAYYIQYLHPGRKSVDFIVEQGQEIGRDGRVYVNAIRKENKMDIFISGTAVFVQQFEVVYTYTNFIFLLGRCHV